MKQALFIALAVLLMAQDCEQPTPPAPEPGQSPYCYGSPTVLKQAGDVVDKAWAAIMGGEPSTDRRATLRVSLEGGLCTGVALDESTYLTAAHCTFGSENPDGSDKATVLLGTLGTRPAFVATQVTEHPEYLQYKYGGNWDLEKRKSDISVVKVQPDNYTGETIPPPYIEKFFDPENPEHASHCLGFIAQGWGRSETSALDLNETKYDIDKVEQRLVVTDNEPGEGRICFGDSGGPLYAEMDNGELWLVGLTRTTATQDCTVQSTHVRVSHFESWIGEMR